MKRSVLVLVAASAIASTASANGPDLPRPIHVYMRITKAPMIDVSVVGEQMATGQDVELYPVGHRERAVHPTSVNSYAELGGPVALAIVYQGQEAWIGNDSFESDPSARFPDALGPLARAIEGARLDTRLPARSQFTLISYADGATTRVPWTPIESLRADMFGSQRDYYRSSGGDLVKGIEAGIEALEQAHAARRMLIVVGDGCDTNNDSTMRQLELLKHRAHMRDIENMTIVRGIGVECPTNVFISSFADGTFAVGGPAFFGDAIEGTIGRMMNDRWYATFDASTLGVFGTGDRELVLNIRGVETDTTMMLFRGPPTSPPWWRASPLRLIGVGALFVGLVALVVRWRSTRRSHR